MDWHGGGRNSAESCIEAEVGSAVWCGFNCQTPSFFDVAEYVCYANPGAYSVNSLIEKIEFNGETVATGEGGGVSCCEAFGRNCGL